MFYESRASNASLFVLENISIMLIRPIFNVVAPHPGLHISNLSRNRKGNIIRLIFAKQTNRMIYDNTKKSYSYEFWEASLILQNIFFLLIRNQYEKITSLQQNT